MSKLLKLLLGMSVLGVIGYIVLMTFFFDPFDFGPCDGDGPPNRQDTSYYDNGKIKYFGTVRNCLWEGEVKYFYKTGELEHIENYKDGNRHGLTKYYTQDGEVYRIENFNKGVVDSFSITDVLEGMTFQFADKKLTVSNRGNKKQVPFDRPTTLYGFDKPFLSILNKQLLLRGHDDFYVIDTTLSIKLNLRDTLMKYIPSAYREIVDISGNHMTFNWHRNFSGDTLKLKVFYNDHPTEYHTKTWEETYILK
jgi:hypothetical protein